MNFGTKVALFWKFVLFLCRGSLTDDQNSSKDLHHYQLSWPNHHIYWQTIFFCGKLSCFSASVPSPMTKFLVRISTITDLLNQIQMNMTEKLHILGKLCYFSAMALSSSTVMIKYIWILAEKWSFFCWKLCCFSTRVLSPMTKFLARISSITGYHN